VPFGPELIHFDYLPPGSCFTAYSAIGQEVQQILNFKAKTNCVIETISVHDDLYQLAKKEPALSNELINLKFKQETYMMTPFDFFRFSVRRTNYAVFQNRIRRLTVHSLL